MSTDYDVYLHSTKIWMLPQQKVELAPLDSRFPIPDSLIATYGLDDPWSSKFTYL